MDNLPPPIHPDCQERYDAVPPERREHLLFSLEFLRSILAKRPYQSEALKCAAEYLTELGCFAEGLELDRRLRTRWPDDPDVMYNLACSLALTGRLDEAIEAAGRAVSLGYADFRHMRRDPDLKALHGHSAFVSLMDDMRARERSANETPDAQA